MPLDPAAATTTASRPVSPLPQPHHHYSPHQQTLPIRAPANPLSAKPHEPHFAYPFAPKGVRGHPAVDHGVAGGAFAPPAMVYGVNRGMHLDYLSHALHVTRPLPHVPFGHVGNAAATPTASPPVKKVSNLKPSLRFCEFCERVMCIRVNKCWLCFFLFFELQILSWLNDSNNWIQIGLNWSVSLVVIKLCWISNCSFVFLVAFRLALGGVSVCGFWYQWR